MDKRKETRSNSSAESSEILCEYYPVDPNCKNISRALYNLNNANSTIVGRKEESRVPLEFPGNMVFEKGIMMDTNSTEGWKIQEISGDNLTKATKEVPQKNRGKKNIIQAEHPPPLRSLDVMSPVISEPKQEILCPTNFNYPQQSIVASYLNKKFTLQSIPQGDQDVLKRAMWYLHKNWIQQTMCDALVSTQDGDILTHQLILAAHSPTLEAIFEKNKKPLPQLIQINMTDYPRDIISDMMNYLYTSYLKVDCKNIANLISISRQLDFPEIINKCGVFLTKSYNHDNVFLHFSVAANNHMKNSKNYLLKVIALNFSLLCQHNHFLYIPFARLNEVISHESLSVEELDVLLALIRWFDFNRTERIQYSESLFSKVKFEQIDPETIANQVEIHDWLFNSKANKNFISQAYKFHALAAVEPTKCGKKVASSDELDNNDNSSGVSKNDVDIDNQVNNNNKDDVYNKVVDYNYKNAYNKKDEHHNKNIDGEGKNDHGGKRNYQEKKGTKNGNNYNNNSVNYSSNPDYNSKLNNNNNIKYNDFSNQLNDYTKAYNTYNKLNLK